MPDKMQVVTFASGSTGNCALVSCESGHILIDAGISMKRIKSNLALSGLTVGDVSGILITHEHSDHISGLAMLIKYYDIPVYAPRTVASHLHYSIAGIDECLHIIPVGEAFELGGMIVTAFSTPHDTEQSVGYRIERDCVFAIATDMGHVTDEVAASLRGADAVIIEANHDVDMLMGGPYPYYLKRRILSPNGHLSNSDCAGLAAYLADSGTRYIVLGHLSRENNTPALAYQTVRDALGGREVFLCAAPAAERLTLSVERRENAIRKARLRR